MRAALIYPHQLLPDYPALRGAQVCVLVEEPLLMTQYRFHRQKLILHRASVMAAQCERMGRRLDEHRRTAEQFLTRSHGEA